MTHTHEPQIPTNEIPLDSILDGRAVYPTAEEILDNLILPSEETYLSVREWKSIEFDGSWSTKSIPEKHEALSELLINILNKEGIEEQNHPQYHISALPWAYSPSENKIYAKSDSPSIISALHELGHFLYGRSELKACAFSVGMFKTCFPNSYAKLKWERHLLVKQDNATT